MADIKVTVLMAVYNGGDYLKIAVDSVLKQDFSDFEILIIDDCSNDGAINEIANRRDPRIECGFSNGKGRYCGPHGCG